MTKSSPNSSIKYLFNLNFMRRKKINERFEFFSIVLNVRGGENIDWEKLTQDGIVDKMIELKFPNPLDLAVCLRNFEGIAQNSNVDKSRIRRFKFESFVGQLEKGLKNGRPHYNLSVKTSSKVLVSTVVRELSLILYNVKNCKSINVEPTHNVDSLDKYCLKLETRLILPSTSYYPPTVDTRVSEFIEALKEDEELKKFMTILVCTNE